MGAAPSFSRKYCIFILLLAQSAVYLQTVGFSWIHLDDYKHIFENRLILEPTVENFSEFWKAPFFSLYIPVTYSVWFVISLFSQSPSVFHLTNVLLHIGSSLLVFFILTEIFKKELPALGGALLFGLHPIQVEAVSWISGLKDCLSGFLVLLTLFLYTLSLQKKRKVPLVYFYILTGLALLSKPSAMILPLLLLVLRRLLVKETRTTSFLKTSCFWIPVLPIAILTKNIQPDFQVQDLAPFWFRPVVALDAIGFYLKQILIPNSFFLDYGKNPTWLLKYGQSDLYLLFFLVGFLAWSFRSWPEAQNRAAIAFFLIPLLPTMGIIPFQFQFFSTVADRYFYLSMLGIAFGFSFALTKTTKILPFIQSFVFLLMLSVFSMIQTYQWRSSEAIFSQAIRKNPNSFLARNNFAYDLFERQRFSEAADQLKVVTELHPEEPQLFLNYSSALLKSGRSQEAKAVLQEVLRKNPNHPQAEHLLKLLTPNG